MKTVPENSKFLLLMKKDNSFEQTTSIKSAMTKKSLFQDFEAGVNQGQYPHNAFITSLY